MGIKFVVDSMIDYPLSMKNEYDFEMLPIPVIIDGKEYSDGIDITTEKLLKMVEQDKSLVPKTAQIPAVMYQEEFEKILKAGDDVICLTLSSGLSGTYQTARLMAEQVLEDYPDRRIEIVDSKCATIGMAMILLQGLKLSQLHKDIDTIVKSMRFLADHVNIFFIVGDIKWLARGGRVSKGAAMVGDMLKIVPILYFEDGKILLFDKVRGDKRAFKKIIEVTEEKAAKVPDQIIGMVAPDGTSWIEKAQHAFRKEDPDWQYLIAEHGAGPALACHIGGQYFGVAFFDEVPEDYIPVL